MHYHMTIMLNRLPLTYTERRMIGGHEEACLVIPIERNQLFYTKAGDVFIKAICKEEPIGAQGDTHRIALFYKNNEEIGKARLSKVYYRTEHIGRLKPFLMGGENRDWTNYATPVNEEGYICLDYIDKRSMVFVKGSNKLMIEAKYTFVDARKIERLCVGMIIVSDIKREDIIVNPRTGLKNIKCVFKKLERMDTLNNTHGLFVKRPDGSEIQIGKFREVTQMKANQPITPSIRPPQREDVYIDGMRL